MNASHPITFVPYTVSRTGASDAAPTPRPERRDRDFGVGYGRSSGYASARRYASNWAPPRFRCA